MAAGDAVRRHARRWADTWQAGGEAVTLAGTSLLRFDDHGLVVEQRDTWNQASGREAPVRGWGDPRSS